MGKISVLIPSRLARDETQALFLERAVASVRAQTIASQSEIGISVGVDVGSAGITQIEQALGVQITKSAGRSQSMALNAAASLIDGDYVCILEDDDHWQPQFLETALLALRQCDFVSSTQLEMTPQFEIIRINIFQPPRVGLCRAAHGSASAVSVSNIAGIWTMNGWDGSRKPA